MKWGKGEDGAKLPVGRMAREKIVVMPLTAENMQLATNRLTQELRMNNEFEWDQFVFCMHGQTFSIGEERFARYQFGKDMFTAQQVNAVFDFEYKVGFCDFIKCDEKYVRGIQFHGRTQKKLEPPDAACRITAFSCALEITVNEVFIAR